MIIASLKDTSLYCKVSKWIFEQAVLMILNKFYQHEVIKYISPDINTIYIPLIVSLVVSFGHRLLL